MKTRVISGLAMVPLLAIVYFGGWLIAIAAFLVAVIGIKEFYKGFQAMGYMPNYIIAVNSVAWLFAFIILDKFDYIGIWLFLTAICSVLDLFHVEKKRIEDSIATFMGICYVGFFASHVLLVDMLTNNRILIWLVFITAFCTDIFAYFTGYLFGKHKLCPKLSPKKTIEGALGGTFFTALASGAFFHFLTEQSFVHGIILGIIGAILAQLGDLSASAFKRKMGIKDYGNLIPGHGGIMDRFDSVLFTAPAIYYYAIFALGDTNICLIG